MFANLFFSNKAATKPEVEIEAKVSKPIAQCEVIDYANIDPTEMAKDIIDRYTSGKITQEEYLKEIQGKFGIKLYVPTEQERREGINLYEIGKRAIVDKSHPAQRNRR